jgi:preprotein translocase subunit SecG
MIYLYIILAIISILLIGTILLQNGKGGGLTGAISGQGATSQMFGGAGAGDFLTKLTTGLAIGFMVLIILIGIMNKGGTASSTDNFQKEIQEEIIPGTQFEASTPEVAAPATDNTEKTN